MKITVVNPTNKYNLGDKLHGVKPDKGFGPDNPSCVAVTGVVTSILLLDQGGTEISYMIVDSNDYAYYFLESELKPAVECAHMDRDEFLYYGNHYKFVFCPKCGVEFEANGIHSDASCA